MLNAQTIQLVSVIVGGLIAITGGILSSVLIESRKNRERSKNLAHSFKGEITAILELIKERKYSDRFGQVIEDIRKTGSPFFMPFKIRYRYDRVYEANIGLIGILKPPLPEVIPLFYTRLTSVLEDMMSLGDGSYSKLDVDLIIRIYTEDQKAIMLITEQGEKIIKTISEIYR